MGKAAAVRDRGDARAAAGCTGGNVPTHMPACYRQHEEIRTSISFAALLVKVTATPRRARLWVWMSQAIRVVSTRVLRCPRGQHQCGLVRERDGFKLHCRGVRQERWGHSGITKS